MMLLFRRKKLRPFGLLDLHALQQVEVAISIRNREETVGRNFPNGMDTSDGRF
jgi:hypothetical protein